MPQPTATHIYILGFSNGTVKVGRTSRLRSRMYQHANWARRNGVAITSEWSRRTNDAKYVEWVMRFLGFRYFPRLEQSTERFEADVSDFIPKLLNDFYKWGIAVNETTATVNRSTDLNRTALLAKASDDLSDTLDKIKPLLAPGGA